MEASGRSPGRLVRGIGAGLVSAAVAVAAMMGVGLLTGQATLAEGVAAAIAGIAPITMIEMMVVRFGSAAKHGLFVSTIVGMIAAGGVIGALAAWRSWSGTRMAVVTVVAAAVVGVALVIAVGSGVYGAINVSFAASLVISLAVTTGVFLALFLAITGRLLKPEEDSFEEPRRVLIEKTILGLGAIALGSTFLRWLSDSGGSTPTIAAQEADPAPPMDSSRNDALVQTLTDGVPGLSPEITPNDKFYVVSKNVFRDPDVNERNWRLQVKGRVDRQTTLTYDDLKSMPSITQYLTLQCISNEIGGDLMGNAKWRGVALGDVLRRAGLQAGAADVILRCADDYTESIPIEKALQPDTILVYEMNDQILPKNHGFPTRLLVPDIYGMKNAKWVTEIEVVEYDFKGYWQNRGWSDVAVMNVTSRIDAPRNNAQLRSGGNYIGGVAVAGQRGIRQVEVSTDGGGTWGSAAIKPALGQDTWVLWLYQWDVPEDARGDRRILVRATDGNGVPQDSVRRDTLPNGATGYYAVTVKAG